MKGRLLNEQDDENFIHELATWVSRNRPEAQISHETLRMILEYKRVALDSPDPWEWSEINMKDIAHSVLPYIADKNVQVGFTALSLVGAFLGSVNRDAEGLCAAAEDAAKVWDAEGMRKRRGTAFIDLLISGYMSSGAEVDRALLKHWHVDNDRSSEAFAFYVEKLLEGMREWSGEKFEHHLGPAAIPCLELPSFVEMRLPPPAEISTVDELVGAARRSVLVAQIVQLSEWLTQQRCILRNGQLVEGVDHQAVTELNWTADLSYQAALQRFQVCWRLAVVTGFVDRSSLVVFPGMRLEEWFSGSDEGTLTAWSRTLEMASGQLVRSSRTPREMQGPALDILTRIMVDAYVGSFHIYPDENLNWLRDLLRQVISLLERHGAVVVDEAEVRITPLGIWWIVGRFLTWERERSRAWKSPTGERSRSDMGFGVSPWPEALLTTYRGYWHEGATIAARNASDGGSLA